MVFIIYDFETNGLNPFHCKIIEYGFINSKGQQINNLVNPNTQISEKITKITNITNDMLVDQPNISNFIKKIQTFINLSIHSDGYIYLIAHNNDGFDKFILNRHIDSQVIKKIKYIDTLLLAKLLLPNMRSFSLKTLSKIFKVKEGTHRAIDDCNTLFQIYKLLIDKLSQKTNYSSEELLENPDIVYNVIYY